LPWSEIVPVIDNNVRQLCRHAYLGHPRGCPNFDRRSTCPPQAQLLCDIIVPPMFVVWNVFPFGAHVATLRKRHPKWTRRQLECCLYWQPKARLQLRRIVAEFLSEHEHGLKTVVWCPEACGVNVTATMAQLSEHLEWPPVTKTHQVAIAGAPVAARTEGSE